MRTEEFARRLIDLRDRRGLSADVVNRLWSIGDEALVDDLDRATPANIEAINEAHLAAVDFERSMHKLEAAMSDPTGDALARLKALADEIDQTLGDTRPTFTSTNPRDGLP